MNSEKETEFIKTYHLAFDIVKEEIKAKYRTFKGGPIHDGPIIINKISKEE